MTPCKKVYILEHISSEKPGTITDFLDHNHIPYEEIELYSPGVVLPEIDKVSHLVVMGGPMNVYEENKFPFLSQENHLIQEVIEAKIPYLGICLGAQLLAKACGAKVYRAAVEEVGWRDVSLTPDAKNDIQLKQISQTSLKVLQWHGDTFDLPKNSTLLATADEVPHQAFRVGENAYGFQFHVEVTQSMLETWFGQHPNSQNILKGYESYGPKLQSIAESLYAEFFQ